MPSGAPTRRPTNKRHRVLGATLFAALVALLALWLGFIGLYGAQESWGEFNDTQVVIAALVTVAVLATAFLVYGVASGRSWGKQLAVATAVDVLLIFVWIVGQLTWCSHCGGP